MPEPATSSFLQTLADEHGVDELLFAGKSTAAPTEARVEAGSPGAPLGAAVSDGDAAGGNGRVGKPLEELPAAHDDLAMVRESLSKLAPEWLPSKLADGKGPLSGLTKKDQNEVASLNPSSPRRARQAEHEFGYKTAFCEELPDMMHGKIDRRGQHLAAPYGKNMGEAYRLKSTR